MKLKRGPDSSKKYFRVTALSNSESLPLPAYYNKFCSVSPISSLFRFPNLQWARARPDLSTTDPTVCDEIILENVPDAIVLSYMLHLRRRLALLPCLQIFRFSHWQTGDAVTTLHDSFVFRKLRKMLHHRCVSSKWLALTLPFFFFLRMLRVVQVFEIF